MVKQKSAKMKTVKAWANVDKNGAVFDFIGDGHLDIYKTRSQADAFRTGDERIARVEIRETSR